MPTAPFAAARPMPLSFNRSLALTGTAIALGALFGLLHIQQALAVDPYGYEILGTLGGSYSIARGVSADGSVVVGM